MDSREKSISVLMLPWLAHGHISPFMELAKRLTKRNFFIYFCSTPANLKSIELSPKFSPSIKLIDLHLPSSPDLPPHYNTTKGLPPNLMPILKKAFDSAAPGFHKILRKLNPDLVIYDMLQPWAAALALSLNIPAVHFYVTSAVMAAFLDHAGRNPGVEFLNPRIFLHDYMKPKFSHLLESISNGMKDQDKVKECHEWSSNIILITGGEIY
ncbi:UDP-glucosyltransferase 29-like [Mangifera indica]|uniref:UDP-glucosyltransferase 29-like n=1 Tax=Mangifera indica TaxID=29780 RepID=UPI001CFB9624|nr:UDP-glucosyltransferase 29-like [Mangifera indica]